MPTYDEILQENVELRRLVAEQERRIAQLEKIIEDLRRGGKRQAAPTLRLSGPANSSVVLNRSVLPVEEPDWSRQGGFLRRQ